MGTAFSFLSAQLDFAFEVFKNSFQAPSVSSFLVFFSDLVPQGLDLNNNIPRLLVIAGVSLICLRVGPVLFMYFAVFLELRATVVVMMVVVVMVTVFVTAVVMMMLLGITPFFNSDRRSLSPSFRSCSSSTLCSHRPRRRRSTRGGMRSR